MVESLTRGVTDVRYFLQQYIVNNKCGVKHRLPSKMAAGGNPSDVIRKGLLGISWLVQQTNWWL